MRKRCELAERYRSVIAELALPSSEEFLKMIALSMLMESRFRPSQECVDGNAGAVAGDEANNPAQAGHVFCPGID
jgi:hypothetical protein